LAIEQVKEANFEDRAGLDSYGVPVPLIPGFKADPNAFRFLTPEDISKYDIESQMKAEKESWSWTFDDPRRGALDLIQEDLHGKAVDPSRLREVHKRIGAVEYELKLAETGKKYTVNISRPYWLSFYAHDPNRVAWVVIYGAVENLRQAKPEPKSK